MAEENKRRIDRETVANALQLYNKEELPSRQVAELIRISPTHTKRILRQAGVIRTPSEARMLAYKRGRIPKAAYDRRGSRNPFYGKHHSLGTKAEIANKLRGRHLSPATEFERGQPPTSGSFQRGHIPHNIIYPDLEPSEPLAYVLGALKGDGSTFITSQGAGQVKLLTASPEFNHEFEGMLKGIGLNPRTTVWKKPKSCLAKKTIYSTVAISKEFVKWYKSMFLDKLEGFITSPELKKAFIRGFYESEGGLHRTNRKGVHQLVLTNTDLDLLHFVKRILGQLNFNFNINVGKYNGFMKSGVIGKLTNAKREEVKRFLVEIRPLVKNELAGEVLNGA